MLRITVQVDLNGFYSFAFSNAHLAPPPQVVIIDWVFFNEDTRSPVSVGPAMKILNNKTTFSFVV
jgi:hypothetical protein